MTPIDHGTTTVTIPEHILDLAWTTFNNRYERSGGCAPVALADAFTVAAPLIPLELARDLLIQALYYRFRQHITDDPSLLLQQATYDRSWAEQEADRLLALMRALQTNRAQEEQS